MCYFLQCPEWEVQERLVCFCSWAAQWSHTLGLFSCWIGSARVLTCCVLMAVKVMFHFVFFFSRCIASRSWWLHDWALEFTVATHIDDFFFPFFFLHHCCRYWRENGYYCISSWDLAHTLFPLSWLRPQHGWLIWQLSQYGPTLFNRTANFIQ